MTHLTDLAISKRSVAIAIVLLVILGGIWSARSLRTELLPNIDVPIATILVVYPGADPQSVADQVTAPIEASLAGMRGLKTLRSTAESGLSITIAEFEYGTNMKDTLASINQAIASVQLPSTAQTPSVGDFDINAMPILRLSLTGDNNLDLQQLGVIAENTVKSRLESIDGVRAVELVGESTKQIVVSLNADKLAQAKIDVAQVSSILQASNVQLPSGDITQDNLDVPVRTGHQITSTQQIEDLVVRPAVPAQMAGAPGTSAGGGSSGGTVSGGAASASRGSAPTSSSPGTYVVKPGDTLWDIAVRFYGNGSASQAIFEANRDKLLSPNTIEPGTELQMPTLGPSRQTAPQSTMAPSTPPSAPSSSASASDPVRIRDLATVQTLDADSSAISRTNGRPSIGLLVYRAPGANTVEVARRVKQELDNITRDTHDVGLTVVDDQSLQIQGSIDDLTHEAILGAFFAILVIYVFLLSARTTIVAAASIPISMLITLILLNANDMSLNMMTLGGMTVAVGRVVDDTVVVLENIYRHLRRGDAIQEAIHSGVGEVAAAITSSTLTTVGVFLPLAFVGGIVGEVFRPFALTTSFALLASLLVALTAIPAIATFLSKGGSEPAKKDTRLQILYTPLIRWSLRHKRLVIGLAIFVLLSSFGTLPLIGTTFLPQSDEKVLEVKVELPPGTDQDATVALASEVEKVIARRPDVAIQQTTIGNTGSLLSSSGFGAGDSSTADIIVRLADSADVQTAANQVRQALNYLSSSATITVSSVDVSGAGGNSVEVTVSGSDYADIKRTADRVLKALQNLDGLANLQSEASAAKPEVAVVVDPEKAIQHGTTAAQVAMAVRQMIVGQVATTIDLNNQPTNVLVRVRPEDANSVDKLRKLAVGTMDAVPLSDIADVRLAEGPIRLTRYNQKTAITITGDITRADTGAVNNDVQKAVAAIQVPNGTNVEFGGVIAQQTEGFSSLSFALLAAVALVYIIMMATMGSLLDPLVILVTLPLASIGALLSLLITGRSLGIAALIGMLMLIGIVVTNAIVLLDLVRRLRAQGMPIDEALVEAGRTRVRPILMTAGATVLALVPSASGISQGSLIATEMATVVIGGLTTSTLLTLIVLPVVYRIAHRVAENV